METSTFVQCLALSACRFKRPLCAVSSVLWPACVVRARKRPPRISCSFDPKTDDEVDKEMKELEGTQLKWAEIDFASVEDELRAIDEYMKEENIDEDDAWPMFLRAGAYESRGQSQLALAQLSKIVYKAGIAKVPNLWERRAYNAFKVGDIPRANAYYDVSLQVYYDAVGNELHFAHWFQENFNDYMPRHNGPAYAIQRGICKYCVGMLKEARECLIGGIIIRDIGSEHAVLWLLASGIRSSTSLKAPDSDLAVVKDWRAESQENDESILRRCLDLYTQSATGDDTNISDLLRNLVAIAEGPENEDSLTAAIYLALYYDSVSKSDEQRDLWLERIAALPGGPRTTNSLDFVYHAAKYKFSSRNFNTDEGIFAP